MDISHSVGHQSPVFPNSVKFYATPVGPSGQTPPIIWFTLIDPLDGTLKKVQGFYDTFLDASKEANESGDTSAPFYGRELRKDNIKVGITFGLWGLSIYLYPEFEPGDSFGDYGYECGGGEFVASVDEVGGRPAYSEFIKVIDYLLSPIKDKVGQIDYGEVEEYCEGGRGFVVVTRVVDHPADRYKPLKAEMKTLGLVTPDDFLERQGYFGRNFDESRPADTQVMGEFVCILGGNKSKDWAYVTESNKYICGQCYGEA